MKLIIIVLLFLNVSLADENGISFWFAGQFSSLVAKEKTPKWILDFKIYYINNKISYPGGTVKTKSPYLFLEPTFSPNTKWFGGQPSFTLSQGYGYDESTSKNLTQTKWDLSNMYPFGEIAWNRENHNLMVYIMGGLPVGTYNPNSLANLGTGHYALDLGFGYTYLNKTSGFESSALLGFTYNFINSKTDYKNGIDSHLDYAISNFFSENWELGVVGYVYYQLSGDSGSGADLGPFKSKGAALGPEGTYFFKSGSNISLRGYYDFWKENRPGGLSVFAVYTIKFPN